MIVSFTADALIDIAIGIERRGIAFYDVMSKSTDNVATRSAFHYLADMEREHIRIFQNMLDEADKYQLPETSTEDYAGYLQTLTDNAVFTDDMVTSEMATYADNDIKALELGISAEKDSILFYYEMRDIMPKRASSAMNKIISEEKTHLRQISELKKELASL
ncbi:ferritin family protein [Chloroflexota bacterium]